MKEYKMNKEYKILNGREIKGRNEI